MHNVQKDEWSVATKSIFFLNRDLWDYWDVWDRKKKLSAPYMRNTQNLRETEHNGEKLHRVIADERSVATTVAMKI